MSGNKMRDREIQAADRRALPKFLHMILICLAAGAVIGFFTAVGDVARFRGTLVEVGRFLPIRLLPGLWRQRCF